MRRPIEGMSQTIYDAVRTAVFLGCYFAALISALVWLAGTR